MTAPLLRAADWAQRLGVSKATVFRIFASGEVPVVQIGRSVRTTTEALEQYIEAHTVKPAADLRVVPRETPAGGLA
jgi:excisionase family DNA binding protein